MGKPLSAAEQAAERERRQAGAIRERRTPAFADPNKAYCSQMAPTQEWIEGYIITYCCRELGHAGPHQWERKWEPDESPRKKPSDSFKKG